MSEPEPLILAFVAHWRALGASRITLYFDNPAPEITRRLRRVPECETIVCNKAYWRDLTRGRPISQTRRQKFNIERSYRETDLDWLFHVDADEFIQVNDDIPIARRLAEVPDQFDVTRLRVAERFHEAGLCDDTIFDGVFRFAVGEEHADKIARLDGASAKFLDRGLAGYPGYKAVFRTGRGIVPSIHGVDGIDPERTTSVLWADLLHFDGLTWEHWIWKKRRALAQLADKEANRRPSIQAQYHAVADVETPEEARALYELVKVLDPPRLEQLETRGQITRLRLDIRRAAWDLFGQDEVDFRPDAFDFGDIRYFSHVQAKRMRNRVRQEARRQSEKEKAEHEARP